MKTKIMILIISITSMLLLASCGVPDGSLPEVNIDDPEATLTISNLLTLEGAQQCSWNFAGLADFGVEETVGTFTIIDGTYYLDNVRDGYHRWAQFDGERFYSWNDNPDRGNTVGQSLGMSFYESSVLTTIGYRSHFAMLENVDYGIVCGDFAGVLPELPDNIQWIEMG
jgi:hypothetical protein